MEKEQLFLYTLHSVHRVDLQSCSQFCDTAWGRTERRRIRFKFNQLQDMSNESEIAQTTPQYSFAHHLL